MWWSPEALSLDARPPFGLRRDDLIVKDVAPTVLREHLDTYAAWQAGRQAAIAAGRTPSMAVMTATEWAVSGIGDRGSGEIGEIGAIEVAIETAARVEDRPGGARFGTLVHALLASMPLVSREASLARLAEAHGRVLGATADEVRAASAAAERVWLHPVLRDAARASDAGLCYRETPVTWRLGEERIVEGTVDLAYVAGDVVVVVDFKTDRELDGALETYRRQVQIYAAAVGSVLGRRARGILMRV